MRRSACLDFDEVSISSRAEVVNDVWVLGAV